VHQSQSICYYNATVSHTLFLKQRNGHMAFGHWPISQTVSLTQYWLSRPNYYQTWESNGNTEIHHIMRVHKH